MCDSQDTRPSLLARLRDVEDAGAWEEFVDIYAPLIYSFGRRSGMQDADAADVTQEVLRKFVAGASKFEYTPARGSFRGWLLTVVRNLVRDQAAKHSPGARGTGDTTAWKLLQEQQGNQEDDVPWWEREHRRQLLHCAVRRVLRRVQESTWEAFRRTAVDGQPGAKVARDLDMTVAAVYLAKRRVIEQLKEEIRRLESE